MGAVGQNVPRWGELCVCVWLGAGRGWIPPLHVYLFGCLCSRGEKNEHVRYFTHSRQHIVRKFIRYVGIAHMLDGIPQGIVYKQWHKHINIHMSTLILFLGIIISLFSHKLQNPKTNIFSISGSGVVYSPVLYINNRKSAPACFSMAKKKCRYAPFYSADNKKIRKVD